MTDGIIQQVFKRYTSLIGKDNYTITWYELKDLQQELIEKIKQTSFSNQWLFDNETKKKLIGDNQE